MNKPDSRFDGLLTSGQMAAGNCISKKTLRFYQQKGLLEPAAIDEDTGFRYYSLAQAAKLDMINQLQTAGFSIDEIIDLLKSGSMHNLRDKADEKLKLIIEEQHRLALAQSVTEEIVDSCDRVHNTLLWNQIVLENVPPKNILEFEMPPYEELTQGRNVSDYGGWELMLRYVKQEILDRGWPLALLRNVCSLTPMDRLHDRYAWREKVFVFVDSTFGECFEHSRVASGNQCLSIYTDAGYDEDGMYIGYLHIERLLDYAVHKNLVPAGPQFVEPVNRFRRFFKDGGKAFARYCLPVKRMASSH